MNIEGITLCFVLWCVLFGAVGQFLRAMVGLYKLYVDPTRDTKSNLDWKRFTVSIVMGACVGGLCCLIFSNPLSKTDVMSIIAFGYVGVDSIEGFMSRRSSTVQ